MTTAGIETAQQHAEPEDLQRSRFSPGTSRRQASALTGAGAITVGEGENCTAAPAVSPRWVATAEA